MDDFQEQDLKEKLSHGPFPRGGFDDRLRNRIMERIEREHGRTRRSRFAAWRSPSSALAVWAAFLLLLGLGAWFWSHPPRDMTAREEAEPAPAAESASSMLIRSDAELRRFALLIGLREDQLENSAVTVSRYRTLLVASGEDPADLRLVADNSGLYVPYGQNFWLIDTVSSADGRKGLRAIQATNRKSQTRDAVVAVPDYLLSERIVYAGNQFASVVTTTKGGQGAILTYAWVKHYNQFNAARLDPASEPHTALQDISFSNPDHQDWQQEQWSIVRRPGKWVPETPQGREIVVDLPPSVIQHDNLLLSWEDIRRIEPQARDAFTYGNMLGVVTDADIRIHAIRNGNSVAQPVVIPLEDEESLVMIQWAEEPYVDRWMNEMIELGAHGASLSANP